MTQRQEDRQHLLNFVANLGQQDKGKLKLEMSPVRVECKSELICPRDVICNETGYKRMPDLKMILGGVLELWTKFRLVYHFEHGNGKILSRNGQIDRGIQNPTHSKIEAESYKFR
ncbi:hypothetical protein WA026_012785 [Henosepilachna vigintioctopunctata]|uniref:Uncharacterized protein n=1 Tax=Henosepilachna vigintioctopunctata TaxID=420089 RepID=A0AAW1U768_9CUCU